MRSLGGHGSGFQCAHWISNWILRVVFVCHIRIIHDFDFVCLYSSFDESWPGVHICTGFDPNVWLMLAKLDPKSKSNPASQNILRGSKLFPMLRF